MSGFIIKKQSKNFTLQAGQLEQYFDPAERADCVENASEGSSAHNAAVLYILPSAFSDLNAHVHWRCNVRENQLEQGGIMIGAVFRVEARICGVVEHMIPSPNSGNATFISFSHADWAHMYAELDSRYAKRADGTRYALIGWYHTHPHMPTTTSEIDRRTHFKFFVEEWQFSAIFNPQRGTWSVYNGSNCGTCAGYLYHPRSWVPRQNSDRGMEERDTRNWWQLGREDGASLPGTVPHTTQSQGTQTQNGQSASVSVAPQTPQQVKSMPPNSSQRIFCGGTGGWPQRMDRHLNEYRGRCVANKNMLYLLPYHEIDARNQYIASMDLVEHMQRMLNVWRRFRTQNVRIALTFRVKALPPAIELRERLNIHCYPVTPQSELHLAGLSMEDGIGGGVYYHMRQANTGTGITMTVLYSESRPDFRFLCRKYDRSDCLLWINGSRMNDFLFFNLTHLPESRDSAGFRIKNQALQDNISFSESDQQQSGQNDSGISASLEEAERYLLSEQDHGQSQLLLFVSTIREVLSNIQNYSPIQTNFFIAIGFDESTMKIPDGVVVLPFFNAIRTLRCLEEINGEASFQQLSESESSCTGLFSLVLTNCDIPADKMKSFLKGHSAAFCLNLENKSYHFYSL